MRIGIIAALDREYEELCKLLGGRSEGRLGNNEIVLAHSGMGKVNSAIKAENLIASRQLDAIVNSGVAGSQTVSSPWTA